MNRTMSGTLAATIIATVAGTAAWLLGIAKLVWPAHPMIAVFLITLVTGIVVKQFWPVAGPEQVR